MAVGVARRGSRRSGERALRIQLQWHMFACSLPEKTNVQRRWLNETIRRDIAVHIKDAVIARVIVRCWSHSNDGRIEAAEKDQRQRWRAPSMRWRNGAWRFDDAVPRIHDASGFDSDDGVGKLIERRGRQHRSRSATSTTSTGTTSTAPTDRQWRPNI